MPPLPEEFSSNGSTPHVYDDQFTKVDRDDDDDDDFSPPNPLQFQEEFELHFSHRI